MSEREETLRRVISFKAHQEKVAREREDYYLQLRTKMVDVGDIHQSREESPGLNGGKRSCPVPN
jgi:hypothetical protein